MININKIKLPFCALALLLIMVSCQVEPEVVKVTGITLNDNSVTLNEGETYILTAMVLPENAANKNVLWSSSEPSVIYVDGGAMMAKKAGKAMVTAKTEDGGKVATCNVTVVSSVTGIIMNKESARMEVGEELALTVTVLPENAPEKSVAWSSSDTAVATVEEGKVKAVNPGKTTITATTLQGGKEAHCQVTVVRSVTGISLDCDAADLYEGESRTLIASVLPEDATNKTVIWSSSNTAFVTVNNGEIKAVSKGFATVSATSQDGGKTAVCQVTVKRQVSNISLDIQTTELYEGENITLTATVLPEDASDKAVTWSTTDSSIATVKDGVVTAIHKGSATITVTTVNGGKTASCIVNVKSYNGIDPEGSGEGFIWG